MNTQAQLAERSVLEIDALVAAVRYRDAAAAALLQPQDERRPDFDDWLAAWRGALTAFIDGQAGVPEGLAEFRVDLTFLLTSYRKDARAFRFMIWIAKNILCLTLPLRPPPGRALPAAIGSGSWIFVLALSALWLVSR